MPTKIDLTGQRFGRLVVMNEAGKRNNFVAWKCRCDCGNEKVITGSSLRNGSTKSCGCLNKEKTKEKHTKHGKCDTKVYQIWASMLARCYNPNSSDYKNYGGRGIKVYRPWWKFKNFYRDMGDKPEGMALERINNDKGYHPNNCKWASYKEQVENTRAKGFHWDKERQKWKAQIMTNHQTIHLGLFNKEKNAKRAYLRAKKKYHTELFE